MHLSAVTMVMLVLFRVLISENSYCRICPDHTMCRFKAGQPGSACGDHYQSSSLSNKEKRLVVHHHNRLRSLVASGNVSRGSPGPQPSATNMAELVWDDELAAIAQRWADQCRVGEHDECRNVDRFHVGQNMLATGSTEDEGTGSIASFVKQWFEEVDDFDAAVVHKFRAEFHNMTSRKRSGSGSKRQLKEKVVQIYESFFKGEDPALGNPNFWDEIFLLKPKVSNLEAEIQKLNGDQLISLKENINTLFKHCIATLGHEHHIRVVYALQTLCALIHSIYKKTCGEFGFDVINILMGFDVAEQNMRLLLTHCSNFLTGDYPTSLKALCLKLLLVLVTGTDNVSQNTLLEYIMINSVFEALIQLLCDPATRTQHGHDAVLLLTLLVNYRKHEAANPYIVKLSILDDELALNGYGQVITSCLTDFCRQFTVQHTEPQTAGWLSSLTNIVGNMFVSEEGGVRTQQIRANNAMLVALYEAVHLNRNFITMLAHTQTDTSAPPSPSNTLSTAQPVPDLTAPPPVDVYAQPSNLLVTFFQYCSIVMQDTKSDASANNVKLCFLILTCVAEDQYANSLMHDVNLVFKVQLHRLPMRHRKLAPDKASPSQPLASTLLDLLVEFLMSHMMKKLPMDLYLHCVGVIHRVLCYQKKCRIRLNYQWKELWTALIALLKYLLANESQLAKKMNIFQLALQVVNIFNLFITYGDTFLPSPGSYDELYYELIRMHQIFENLYSMALRYSTNDGDYKENALRLTNSLINVRAIINHFTPKIETWLSSQSLSTPSEDQILEVVRKNYDSLTLKLQDSLDQYERYAEKPRHASFFTAMVRNVVHDTRQNIDFASMDLQLILQEFSSIS